MAGLVIGWVSYYVYSPGNDYWTLNKHGWEEYQLLWNNPKEYFTNLFHSGYSNPYGGLFDSFGSFWNDLRNNIIIKFLSICNIFSQGNYYINSLFFNFFCFFGHVAFYRIFIQLYKNQRLLVILCTFFLPSVVYFSSGIQKDGIVFTALGVLCYATFQSLNEHRVSFIRILLILLAFIILFLIRSYVLINLLPAYIIWVLVGWFKWAPLKSFIIGYIAAGILLFNINSVLPSVNPLKIITKRQADFMALETATTEINLDTLRPDFASFLHNAPQAYNHLLLRPYLTELPKKSMLPLNIETFIYQLLFVLFLIFRKKSESTDMSSFIFFGVFFTLTMFLFIGYIMPNLGSLIRYRSIYIPFLITPVICGINWQSIAGVFKIKK